VCCNASQCSAVFCSALQHVAVWCSLSLPLSPSLSSSPSLGTERHVLDFIESKVCCSIESNVCCSLRLYRGVAGLVSIEVVYVRLCRVARDIFYRVQSVMWSVM